MSDERLCEITRPDWRHISSEVQALKGKRLELSFGNFANYEP